MIFLIVLCFDKFIYVYTITISYVVHSNRELYITIFVISIKIWYTICNKKKGHQRVEGVRLIFKVLEMNLA